jgi:SNF2 family DNA or RNA helicase
VEVQGVGIAPEDRIVIEATRDGEILAGPRLGKWVQLAGGVLQMEAIAGGLRFRNALTLGDGPTPGGKRQAAGGEFQGLEARRQALEGEYSALSGEYPALNGEYPVRLDDVSALPLLRRVSMGDFCDPRQFFIAWEAAELEAKPGFEQLLSLTAARGVTPYQHQLNTVTRVLRSMRGRALLCDEVGLGKTIEAGLVLLEYLLRSQVRRVLILTPPSLIYQWQEEMAQKFNLDFVVSESREFKALGPEAWSRFERIIASISRAKRGAHLERVQQTPFDMVIVDEAHYLRNRETRAWKLVNGLDKKYILLLTATPVQNNLDELFNLVTLLKPGLLRTAGEFRQRFVARDDELQPRNVEELQRLVGQVMVRNRRSAAGVAFSQRHAHTVRVEPGAKEAELRRLVTGLVREAYPLVIGGACRGGGRPAPSAAPATGLEAVEIVTPGTASATEAASVTEVAGATAADDGGGESQPGMLTRWALKTMQMELGSSPAALVSTVERLLSQSPQEPAAARLRAILDAARAAGGTAKLAALTQTLGLLQPDEKVLVFTHYLGTLEWLRRSLQDWSVAVYHGGLSVRQKDEAVDRFRKDCQVLLSTDAGGEGRNLQFCHVLVNFDLPWNPMRIEQRIGRLSRIGQPRDVHIFNLSTSGSIEDQILDVLDRKVNLFELVVGELDLILGKLEDERDLEDIVMDLVGASPNDEAARQKIEELGERLKALKDDHLRVKALDDALFQGVGGE